MLLDCFTFFNEYDMLEFRLKYLWDEVDYFVIVEADHTFSGKPKPFNYEENKERFAWAAEKIIYHKFYVKEPWDGGNPPDGYDPAHLCWKIERDQRDEITRALDNITGDFAGFTDDALVMIGDVDEIPTRESIEYLKICMTHPAVAIRMFFFYYNLTNLRKENWNGTIFTTLGFARQTGAQALRDGRNAIPFVYPGGMHLSYFGGAEVIKNKVESFSHQELNIPQFKSDEHIDKCLKTGADLFNRPVNTQTVDASFFPPEFVELAKAYDWGL